MAEVIPIKPLLRARLTGPLPDAPGHLSESARESWSRIVARWDVGPDGEPLLRVALEQLDLYDQLHEQIQREGPTIVNPESGLTKPHPAAGLMHAALKEFRLALRQLGLQPEGD